MATQQNRGAGGRLRLYCEFFESSSGHLETTRRADLAVRRGSVVLTVTEETTDFIRGHHSTAVQQYTIEPKRLVELICAHGEPADPAASAPGRRPRRALPEPPTD